MFLAEFGARWRWELLDDNEVLERSFPAATQLNALPEAHWMRLCTPIGVECLHGEIKPRIKAPRAFPERAGVLRLIAAVAIRVTTLWRELRYIDLSPLNAKDVARPA